MVCLLARIRNLSTQTFYIIKAGDPFYTPKVNGAYLEDERFEIAPGAELACESLLIPWSMATKAGLVVGQVGAEAAKLRCAVGPADFDDGGVDWLRLHDDEWNPIAMEHWVALGRRHLLGTIGSVVELQLTFREPINVQWAPEGPEVSADEAVEAQALFGSRPMKTCDSNKDPAVRVARQAIFEREALCAPANTVFLNVYDLTESASIPNAMLNNSLMKSFGAFHATIEVFGEEWGFYRQSRPEDCGICRSRYPRRHPIHVYRQSVNLGPTRFKDYEVWDIIREKVLPEWPSRNYDLIHCNCIHFAMAMAQLLEVQAVPAWVSGLHETGAALLKLPWPMNLIVSNLQSQASGAADPEKEEGEEAAKGEEAANDGSGDAARGSADAKKEASGKLALPSESELQEQAPASSEAQAEDFLSSCPAPPVQRPDFLPSPLGLDESPASTAAFASAGRAGAGCTGATDETAPDGTPRSVASFSSAVEHD